MSTPSIIEEMHDISVTDRIHYTEEGFISSIRRIIPSILDRFTKFVNVFKAPKPVYDFDRVTATNVNIIKGHDYIDLSDITVPIPQHYSGTYLDYVIMLKTMTDYNESLLPNLLSLERNLGIIISTPNGVNTDFTNEIKRHEADRKRRNEIKDNLASYFTSKSADSGAPYSQVVKRNHDLSECLTFFSYVADNQNKIDSNQVLKISKNISTHLTTLKKMLSNDEFGSTNKTLVEYLQIAVLEMAEEMEFFSLTRYQIDIFRTLFLDAIKQVLDSVD